jgi:protein TonB
VVKGTQELIPPETPPTEIKAPDPNQVAVRAEDFSGQGTLGGVANGVANGVAQDVSTRTAPPDQGTYDLESVQEKPDLQNRADLARNLSRNYPPLLRDAGVGGQVQVKFRVNEDGRVDAESIEIIDTSHEAFGDATKRVVERMRFRPAKVDGRPVKVWVILPITWQVPR